MAEPTTNRSKGGSKLSKTEVTTVRLDPKLRYLADLAARRQRRTLSSFIEWAIEEALKRSTLHRDDDGRPAWDDADLLWDVDPAYRFAILAFQLPSLLTHEEQVAWKLVRECGHYWRGKYVPPDGEWRWKVEPANLITGRVRDTWDLLWAVVHGDRPLESMPYWFHTMEEAMADAQEGDADIAPNLNEHE